MIDFFDLLIDIVWSDTPLHQMAIKKVCTNFLKTTSVKGIGKVINARTSFLRLTWIVCVMFGLSMTAYLLSNIVLQYYEYGSTTSIKEIRGTPGPPFPDITICKLNPNIDNYDDAILDSFNQRFKDVLYYLMNSTESMENDTDNNDSYNNYYTDYDYSGEIKSGVDREYYNAYSTYYYAPYTYDYEETDVDLLDLEHVSVPYDLLRKMQVQDAFFQFVTMDQIKDAINTSFLQMCQYETWRGIQYKCRVIKPYMTFVSPQYPHCMTFRTPQSLQMEMKSFIAIIYLHDFLQNEKWNYMLKYFKIKDRFLLDGIDTTSHPAAAKGAKVRCMRLEIRVAHCIESIGSYLEHKSDIGITIKMTDERFF